MKKIKQTITFNASAEELYELLMDSKNHAGFTGDSAKISRKEGGKFSAYGDYIEGVNISLVPNKLIVQKWRASDWPKDHFSTVTFSFKETKGKTKLDFTQENVPDNQVSAIKKGWVDFYWQPIKYALKENK